MPRKALPAIKEASADVEFKKTNSAIGLVVAEGKLSFLDRKIFNVCMYHAQRLGKRGADAPVRDATSDEYYWALYSDFVKDADFGSRDTEYFLSCVDNLQSIRVVTRTEKDVFAERLLGPARIHKETGTEGRGGRVWIGFRFDPNVEQQVLNPMPYTRLSLYYQAMLRTGPGLALYEMSRKYATSPSHMTFTEKWEWWHDYLTGQAISSEPLNIEYKYFKRNIIKPAVEEVNAVTNLTVELKEIKNGRRVVSLQFTVSLNSQSHLEMPPEPVIDSTLISELRTIGISEHDAQNFCAREDHELLRRTATLLKKRMENRSQVQVDSPLAYFRKLLRERSAENMQVTEPPALPRPTTRDDPAKSEDPETAARRLQALQEFDSMDDVGRAQIIARFVSENPTLGASIRRNANSKMIRSALASWLIRQA